MLLFTVCKQYVSLSLQVLNMVLELRSIILNQWRNLLQDCKS
jgi:hypothetical protein